MSADVRVCRYTHGIAGRTEKGKIGQWYSNPMATRISLETAARCAAAWPDVLAAIEAGETAPNAAAPHGLTPGHLWAFRADSPERRKEWEDARRSSADALADEALATARNRGLDSGHARVLTDTLKWAAAKRNPDHYADRSRHDVNVKSLDLTPILQRAEQRLQLAQAAGRVLEGVVLDRVEAPADEGSSLF